MTGVLGAERSTTRYRWLAAVAIAAVISATGCSLKKLTVRQTADVLTEGSVVIDRESDPKFAREAFPASLKTFESLLVHDPGNEGLLKLLAEGYFSYAFGFIEQDLARAQVELASEKRIETLTERALIHYLRSRDYGFRLLGHSAFEKAARKPDVERVEQLLDEMEKEDVPGLFWTAYGWGSAINLGQQNPDLAAKLPVVEAMMKRVLELDEDYYDAGAHLFFGVSYASRPKMAGGDPDKAKKHFEAAMEEAGQRNLMIPFLYGRYYGAQTQNRELFDQMMNTVLEGEVEPYPDNRLNNEIAKDRAEFWKQHADDLFY